MEHPPRKRKRTCPIVSTTATTTVTAASSFSADSSAFSSPSVQHNPLEPLIQQQEDDFWSHRSFFAFDTQPLPDIVNTVAVQEESDCPGRDKGKKRSRDHASWDRTFQERRNESSSAADMLAQFFPSLWPSLPSLEDRRLELDVVNPYIDNAINHHRTLRAAVVSIPEDGAINGYIKFRLRMSDFESDHSNDPRRNIFGQQAFGMHHRQVPGTVSTVNIPNLPPDFGRGCKLDPTDRNLLTFYVYAFCRGRTLLPKTNAWLVDLTPMLAASECVKHALLAVASTYVLDYLPDDKLRIRANFHYRRAVEILGEALSDPVTYEVGKGDSAVGAIILLNAHDIVTWELRRPKGVIPRWLEGARLARKLLDASDPGYRYWRPENVQTSNVRASNANVVAHVAILALPVTPLQIEETDKCYAWLLEGTENDVRMIHGGTGVCAKLLHMFAQITHLAARMNDDPESTVMPLGAKKIEEILTNFRQWSQLSCGSMTGDELLASCKLNDKGEVDCPIKITELGGEAWVAAAQIYLQCRFFRKPRSHSDVRDRLRILSLCIQRMPCTGPLFTGQAPFFPVFVMGIVSYDENDRRVVQHWFETVLSGASCRSSVPPVWRAVQFMWTWMDTELVDDLDTDNKPIGQRYAWWEAVVERLMETEGVLSLV